MRFDTGLAKALAFSLGVHLALLMAVQPAPFKPATAPVLEVHMAAALASIPDQPAPPRPAPTAEPVPVPVAVPVLAMKPVPLPALMPMPSVPPQPVAAPPAATTSTPPPSQPVMPPAVSALPEIAVPFDPTWYPVKEVDVPVRTAQPIATVYPELARDHGIEGVVTLQLHIDENGTVHDAEVVSASPSGYFEDNALKAARQAHFIPARKGGRPVRSLAIYRVRFELAN